MATTPLILCGLTTQIGSRVTENLKPEYQDAKAGIPSILARQPPSGITANEIGSHDYSRVPQIVLFGRGFQDSQVQEIREAVGGAEAKLAWIQSSAEGRKKAQSDQNVQPGQAPPDPAKYAQEVTATLKRYIEGLAKDGKLGQDGLHYY